MKLVLASTSPYRKLLLSKIVPDFECHAPQVKETNLPGESPEQMALRLAQLKAEAVAMGFQQQDVLVIGSDQVACVKDTVLGKPGNEDKAFEQLSASSGQEVNFYTGLCLVNAKTMEPQSAIDLFTVKFRNLTESQILAYIRAEQPLDCAGSFKSEGLGIGLFDKMVGNDPNSLVGLPLILLNQMLFESGYDIFEHL